MVRGKGLDDDVTSNSAEDEEVRETHHQHDVDDEIIHEDNN